MHTLLHKYYTLECSHPNSECKKTICLTSLSSASCQVMVVHSIVLPRFCTLWNSWPNVCECFTAPWVIPRVSMGFRELRVSEGLQRVSGGIGTGVPRSVPASSVPAFRGLTRTRRSTGGKWYHYIAKWIKLCLIDPLAFAKSNIARQMLRYSSLASLRASNINVLCSIQPATSTMKAFCCHLLMYPLRVI